MRRVASSAGIVAALLSTAVAFGRTNSVHIALAPSSGKYGTVYKIAVSGFVAASNEQLALAMTNTPGKCPASYTKGFSRLSGLAKPNGQPMGPTTVKKGRLAKTIKAKITISDPGAYGICAYLQLGAATKAHAAATFTITQ
jgi:hypothetical protein